MSAAPRRVARHFHDRRRACGWGPTDVTWPTRAVVAVVVLGSLVVGCGSSRPTARASASSPSNAHPSAASVNEPRLYMVVRITELGSNRLYLQAVFSSSNGRRGTAGSKLLALPCPERKYRYAVNLNDTAVRQLETYEATITMGAAQLPTQAPCGRPLPSTLGDDRLTLAVYGNGGRAGHGVWFEATGRRLQNGNLVGFFPRTIGNTLCAGQYRLVARLTETHHALTFDYPFLLSDVKGAEKC
jgi:hypothetical protein